MIEIRIQGLTIEALLNGRLEVYGMSRLSRIMHIACMFLSLAYKTPSS